MQNYYFQVETLADAMDLIDDLKCRLKCRGHQIVGCKRRLKQQVSTGCCGSVESLTMESPFKRRHTHNQLKCKFDNMLTLRITRTNNAKLIVQHFILGRNVPGKF